MNILNQKLNIKPNVKNNNKKVQASAIAGSAIGIACGVAGVYAMAKKANPLTTLKNLSYEEKDVLIVGASSVLGGLTGGLLADSDKKNIKPKLREASQQYLGNMACPIGLLAAGNKLLDKTNFQLPKINSNSKPAQAVNTFLNFLPRAVVTISALVGGMEIGNKIMNRVNNKVFNEEVKHEIEPDDYFVHADDICLTANMLLKNSKNISSFTSKILPLTFIIAGSKTGMKQVEK